MESNLTSNTLFIEIDVNNTYTESSNQIHQRPKG